MTDRTGGCLCGAVRYAITGDPAATVICHCTHCQKQSGAMFSTNLVVPEAAYAQSGQTRIYKDTGDSGGAVDRYFCSECGSPILSRAATVPGMVLIKAGTLDDDSGLRPAMEVYGEHAADWIPPVEGARRFAKTPG